ncbi:MAG TPA: hypothetical protein VNH83_18905 [Bryobacteraceae bacterium]|nr:hypothetical protein [Bryobacteraceae bacterium]
MPLSLAQLLTAPVSLRLGSSVWSHVVFTHRDLLEIEAQTGIDVLAGALHLRRCPARAFAAVVSVVLGIEARAIAPRHFPRVREALAQAWDASMPDPEPPGRAPKKKSPGPTSWCAAWAEARALHVPSAEWLEMTPRMMQALGAEHLELMRQAEFMQSKGIASICNHSYVRPKKLYSDTNFMSHPWPDVKKEAPQERPQERPQTGEDFMRMVSPFRKAPIQCANEEARKYVESIVGNN